MAGENDGKFTPPQELKAGLTKKEKLKFSGLVFLSLLILTVGFWQLRRGIKGPFEIYLSQATQTAPQTPTSSDLMTAAELRAKDTDKDGLNDYEELNIYHTSPYVADTDSDGFDDKKEVTGGNDPNCPSGKTCGGAEATKPIVGSATVTDPEAENLLQSLSSGNFDPKTIREMLTQQGIDKQILDNLTDAELQEVFKKAVETTSAASAGQSVGGAGATPAAPAIISIEDLKNISALDLRALLKQRGVSEAALDKINDADLLAAFNEAMK